MPVGNTASEHDSHSLGIKIQLIVTTLRITNERNGEKES